MHREAIYDAARCAMQEIWVSSSEVETILIVCADADQAATLISRLHDKGANAVGPASTAGLALALAAQVAPCSAILVGPTTGRRDAHELARELEAVWGVECFMLASGDDPAVGDEAGEERAVKLSQLLGAGNLRRALLH